MGLYPYNGKIGQTIQSDITGYNPDRGFIAHVTVTAPDAATGANILALTALTSEVQTVSASSLLTDPDFPRCLQIDSNSSVATGNVLITGTDYADAALTETIALNGTTNVAGTKAFKTVISVRLPVKVASESVSVGVTDKLGMPYKLSLNTVLATYLAGTLEGTAPTVTVSSTVLASNTIDLNTALDSSKTVDYFVIV